MNLGDVQIAVKQKKIDKNEKFFKNLEKLNLTLSFAVGFIKIHLLAQFLQQFEVG